MQINNALVASAYYNYNFIFQGAIQQTPTWWERVATRINSTTRSNRYPWMAMLPKMRQWVGERVFHNLVERATVIDNLDWEDSVEVDRNDIEDDNLGLSAARFAMLGAAAAKWPDQLVAAAIQSTTVAGYDGQTFFNGSHPINPDSTAAGTYQNLFTAMPLTVDNYNTVRSYMGGIIGEGGTPLAIRPDLLLVAPANEQNARRVVQADTILQTGTGSANVGVAGVTNVMKGTAEILVIPEFANDPGTWYLIDTTKPVKPIIFQVRKDPTMTSIVDPQSETVFLHKKFQFGIDSRGNAGVSLPYLMAKVQAT